jgi:protein KTI12
MPLIIVCGIPSSGKTSRSNKIKQYFIERFSNENKTSSVHLINDESLGINKDSYRGILAIR